MNENQRQAARDLFIRRRMWADFEALCPTKEICGNYQLPSSCGDCRWDSRKAFEDAQAAADRLEAKAKEA